MCLFRLARPPTEVRARRWNKINILIKFVCVFGLLQVDHLLHQAAAAAAAAVLKLLLSVHHHHSGVSEKSCETSVFGGKTGVANTVCATQGPLQEVDTARETSFSH